MDTFSIASNSTGDPYKTPCIFEFDRYFQLAKWIPRWILMVLGISGHVGIVIRSVLKKCRSHTARSENDN